MKKCYLKFLYTFPPTIHILETSTFFNWCEAAFSQWCYAMQSIVSSNTIVVVITTISVNNTYHQRTFNKAGYLSIHGCFLQQTEDLKG